MRHVISRVIGPTFQRAHELITGLVYHAASPVICIGLMLSFGVVEGYVFENEIGSQRLKVSFLDIGQGDSILIQTPRHQTLLIDGGPTNGPVLQQIGKTLPFYRRRIDMIMATHPDADHIGGLPDVVDRYRPTIAFESGVHSDTWIDKTLQKEILENNVDELRARKGMKIVFENENKSNKSLALEILFPDRNVDSWIDKTNDASIVARLTYGKTSFVFTGDSPIDIEHYLSKSNSFTTIDVLKVGHHGSRTSTSDEFVKSLTPKIAVISVGKKNKYGHPHQEALDILENNNVKVFRTDQCGKIEIESDGKQILPIDNLCGAK